MIIMVSNNSLINSKSFIITNNQLKKKQSSFTKSNSWWSISEIETENRQADNALAAKEKPLLSLVLSSFIHFLFFYSILHFY